MIVDMVRLVLQVLAFLLSAVFVLRFYMHWQRMPFYGAVGQFVKAATDWLCARRTPPSKVTPLRRGRVWSDWLPLAAALGVQLIHVALLLAMLGGLTLPVLGLPRALGLAVLGLATVVLNLLTALVLVEVVLSWVNPHSPVMGEVGALVEPFLRPFRRVIPPLGGVDLSPLVLLLIIQVVQVAVSRSWENGLLAALAPFSGGML